MTFPRYFLVSYGKRPLLFASRTSSSSEAVFEIKCIRSLTTTMFSVDLFRDSSLYQARMTLADLDTLVHLAKAQPNARIVSYKRLLTCVSGITLLLKLLSQGKKYSSRPVFKQS